MAFVESPARIRARELVGMLERATGPDNDIDIQICQLMNRSVAMNQFTRSIDDAKRLVKRYYQWGMRQYLTGDWGAYVEVDGDIKGFVWAVHRCEPIALAMAALKSHIAEMQ
jgi:hypothetical protein